MNWKVWSIITHLFPMHPFSSPWKHQKNLRFFWCFQGEEKGCIGNKWVNILFCLLEVPIKFLDVKILINGITEPVVVQLSNHDTVQDIRQIILEKPECCYRTCFSLYLNGTRLDDFMELHDIKELKDDSVIKVVDGIFTFNNVVLL